MEIHKLLKRQLNNLEMNEFTFPENLIDWQAFLAHINNTYIEADQERYLLERIMKISSREFQDLNKKLEDAALIAHMGYWSHDMETDTNIWSKSLYQMFALDSSKHPPSLDTMLALIHEEDKPVAMAFLNDMLNEGKNVEFEMRMRGFNNDIYRWYHIIAHPSDPHVNKRPILKISGIAIDITSLKEANEKLYSLQQKFLISAREAGMADIATNVLHNVENILNSINVSIVSIHEQLNNSIINDLQEVSRLLKQHKKTIADYISKDKNGKYIPEFISKIYEKLNSEKIIITNETKSLEVNLSHIRDIITLEQSLSTKMGLTEKTDIPELIKDVLMLTKTRYQATKIQIVTDFSPIKTVIIDREKLFYVLTSLVINAIDSVLESNNHNKKIILRLKQKNDRCFMIQINDTGVGIKHENLKKIFSYEFTTKTRGHGFGLHTSVNYIEELSGSISAESEGENKGATFTLVLPFKSKQ